MRDRNFYTAGRSEIGHVLRLQGRHAEAAAVYVETLSAWQDLGHRAAVAHELECLAYCATAAGQGSFQRAAHLLGAAEALRERIGSSILLMEHQEYDQVVAQLRTEMEATALQAAWAQGRSLSLDEAVAYARAEGQ
jgi:hypothetical protein